MFVVGKELKELKLESNEEGPLGLYHGGNIVNEG